jgi:4-hydroxy-3-polyprenylbenzoate decarboxylase
MVDVRRVVLGVSGASGAALALKVAEMLSTKDSVETHLVVSSAAERTLSHEQGPTALHQLKSYCRVWHDNEDVGASIASGSFRVHGMIVAPCSMRTLAAITSGNTDNLLTRSADVQLKERRRLVLLTRETPLHLGHLRNMTAVTEMGAIVMPPVPAFYHRPASVEEIVHHISARAIDLLDLSMPSLAKAWLGDIPDAERGHL